MYTHILTPPADPAREQPGPAPPRFFAKVETGQQIVICDGLHKESTTINKQTVMSRKSIPTVSASARSDRPKPAGPGAQGEAVPATDRESIEVGI